MTQMCGDKKMLEAYQQGKDLYAQIASLAFDKSYKDCYEFYIDDDGNYIDLEGNVVDKEHRITYKEGKERRSQAKSILLRNFISEGV